MLVEGGRKMLKKAVCVGLAAAMLALVGCGGNKQANNETSKVKWPKNVEIIVPYGAGGDTDFNARLLAPEPPQRRQGPCLWRWPHLL